MNCTGYPDWFDEITDEPTNCHNCNDDCPGAYLLLRGDADVE